jgi:hypothetical protein
MPRAWAFDQIGSSARHAALSHALRARLISSPVAARSRHERESRRQCSTRQMPSAWLSRVSRQARYPRLGFALLTAVTGQLVD